MINPTLTVPKYGQQYRDNQSVVKKENARIKVLQDRSTEAHDETKHQNVGRPLFKHGNDNCFDINRMKL